MTARRRNAKAQHTMKPMKSCMEARSTRNAGCMRKSWASSSPCARGWPGIAKRYFSSRPWSGRPALAQENRTLIGLKDNEISSDTECSLSLVLVRPVRSLSQEVKNVFASLMMNSFRVAFENYAKSSTEMSMATKSIVSHTSSLSSRHVSPSVAPSMGGQSMT